MKKKVLFVMPGLYSGGAEKSLVNLLNLLDYSKLDVDLLLFKKEGLFMNQVPSEVNILNIPISLKYSYSPLDGDALKSFSAVKAGVSRVIGTLFPVYVTVAIRNRCDGNFSIRELSKNLKDITTLQWPIYTEKHLIM